MSRQQGSLVSVVMSVYNGEQYLREAIDSILKQTYTNLEFIIIDDGSTDTSLEIIRSYNDKRIRCISRKNKGLPASLNEGIALAQGIYIARQDADDISEPSRLEKEVNYLDSHPRVDLVGTNYVAVKDSGEVAFKSNFFTRPNDLKLALVFTNQFGHGSVMIRASVFEKAGVYHEISIVQDYDLWVRISHVSEIANLKEPLYRWRYLDDSLSNSDLPTTIDQATTIRQDACAHLLANQSAYRQFSFQPFSIQGGVISYCKQKGVVYRELAQLYTNSGLRRRAIPVIVSAIVVCPWVSGSYRLLWATLLKAS